jgi:hypothetical protein
MTREIPFPAGETAVASTATRTALTTFAEPGAERRPGAAEPT